MASLHAILLCLIFTTVVSQSIIQISLDHRKIRIDDDIYCESWRFSIETNDAGNWSTIPERCLRFVQDYTTGDRYRCDSELVAENSLKFAKTVEISGNGSDAWVFDIDETLLSNLPYYELNGFGAGTHGSEPVTHGTGTQTHGGTAAHRRDDASVLTRSRLLRSSPPCLLCCSVAPAPCNSKPCLLVRLKIDPIFMKGVLEVSSDSLQDLRVGDRNLNVNSQEWTEKPWTPEIHESQDRSHIGDGLVGGFGNYTKSANTESLKMKDNNGSYMIGLSGSLTGLPTTKSANTESPKQKDDNGGCMIGLSGSLTGPQNRKSANTESPMQKDNNGGCMIGLSGSLSGPQSTKSANAELLKQKDNNGRCMIVLSGSHTGPQNGIVDESFMVPSQNEEKWKNIADTIQADNQQEKMTNCVEGDLNGSPSNVKVKDEMLGLMTSPCITESRGKQIAPVNQICENILSVQGGRGDHALVAYQSNPIDLDRLQNTIHIGAVSESGAPPENPIEPVQDPEVGGSVSGVKVKVEEGECENFGQLEVRGCVSVVKVKEEQEWENWENLRSCIEEEMGKVGLVVESGNLGIGGGSDVKKEVVSDVDESESSDSESSSSSEAATSSSGSSDDDDDDEEEEEDKDKKEVKVEVMTGAGEQGEVEEGELRDADEQEMVGGINDDDDDDKDMEEDEEEEEIDEDNGKEMVSFSDFDEEEDDEGGAPKGPIKSKHELEVLPPVPPVDVTLQPHHPMLPVGVVLLIFGAHVIVEGVEKHNPITEGSILWITESRSPLGLVDEIFGPVKSPYYKVRYNSESEVPSGIQAGSLISFVLEFANHVLSDKDLYKKGYDASGANDEEVLDEAEFSDDEQEAEFKRVQKMTKRGTHDQNVGNMKNNRKKGKNKNGPWKNAQPSPQKPQEQPSNQSQYNFSPSAVFFDRGSSSSSMGQGFVIGTGFIPPFPQTAQTIGFNTPSQKPHEQPSNQSQHNFLPSASFFDRGSSSSSMGQGFVIGTGFIPPFPQTAQTIGFNTPSQKPQEQPSNQSQYNFSPSAAFFDRGSSSSSLGQGFVIGTGFIPPFPQTAQTFGFNTPSNGVWTNGMPFQPPHNAVFPSGFPTNGMPWFSQNPNQHPCQMPMPNRMPFQQQFDPSQIHPTAMFPAVGPTYAQGLLGQNGFNQSPFGMGLQGQHTHPLMNMGMNVGDQGILSNGLQVQQNSMQQSAFAPGNVEAAQQFNMCASSHCGRNPYHRGGGRFVGVRGWQQSK
ncbi:H/ACA ribonucleoprotein complex non-core subunit NAF1 [Fagus crenata]